MYSENTINSFQLEKRPDRLLDIYYFYHFVKNFSALLLCKIINLDNFNIDDVFEIFVILTKR